jgi:hypothetical protein
MRTIARCVLTAAIALAGAAQQATAAGAATGAAAERRLRYAFTPVAGSDAKPAGAMTIVRPHDLAIVVDLGDHTSLTYIAKSDHERCMTEERIRVTAGNETPATIIADRALPDCGHPITGAPHVSLQRGSRTIEIDSAKWASFGVEAIAEEDLGAAIAAMIRGPLVQLAAVNQFIHLAGSRIAPLLIGDSIPAAPKVYIARRLP